MLESQAFYIFRFTFTKREKVKRKVINFYILVILKLVK